MRIKIGRKRRKRFLQAYAKLASKFVMIREEYGKKMRDAAERLYRALEKYESLDLIESVDDVSCAIFLAAGLKELGNNSEEIVRVFDANLDRVRVLLTMMASDESGLDKNGNIEQKNEEKQDETH